jgi:hypothetical protein
MLGVGRELDAIVSARCRARRAAHAVESQARDLRLFRAAAREDHHARGQQE